MNRLSIDRRSISAILIGVLTLCLCTKTWAEASAADQPGSIETDETTTSMVDRSYDSVDSLVQSTVRRIDGFFVNDEHSTFTDRKSRIRLRLNSDYIQHAGWDFSPKVKLHLVLPGMNDPWPV